MDFIKLIVCLVCSQILYNELSPIITKLSVIQQLGWSPFIVSLCIMGLSFEITRLTLDYALKQFKDGKKRK